MFARQKALAHPGQPAIIMATSGETVTFGEYEARSNQVAHLLREAGLRRGDHIAVFIENSPQLLEIEGGAERAECIVHAAAPCPVHVKRAMIDWLGPVITEYYGATEANGFTFCTSAEWLAHPGTVGRAILGELLILDGEGHPCPAGTDGTIWFRGATAFEYFQDPARSRPSCSSSTRPPPGPRSPRS